MFAVFSYLETTVGEILEQIIRIVPPAAGAIFLPGGKAEESLGYRIMAFSMRTHHCRISFLSDTFIAVATL